jgi:hypothetical protein
LDSGIAVFDGGANRAVRSTKSSVQPIKNSIR